MGILLYIIIKNGKEDPSSLATPMRPSKPSQSMTPESDGESHGTTKPVGVTLKTKTLKPIS